MKYIKENNALELSYKFWHKHNSANGYPEHYPDEEVIKFLMGLKGNAKKNKINLRSVKVLDLASGSGKNSIPVSEIGFDLYCVDYSKPGLDYTKKRLKKLKLGGKFLCIDFVENPLPFPNDFFDAIISIQVFDHIFLKSFSKVLQETSRVLKPKGKMIASIMGNKTSKENRRGILIKNNKNSCIVSTGNSAGEIHTFYDLNKIKKLFEKNYKIDQAALVSTVFENTKEFTKKGERIECEYFSLLNKF